MAWSLYLVVLAASMYASPPDVRAIIQRSLDANQTDWSAAPQYSYCERDGPAGDNKTYEVTMILGSPYRRLVAINGEPLSAVEQSQEQQQMNEAANRRRAETATERDARTAEYERERKRDHILMNELTKAFDFRYAGQSNVDGHDVYVLKATPRSGYRPPNTESEVLTGMGGTLWIDTATFQWVKVEAHVLRPVFIAGFLARVEPGTHFELEKAPVERSVWLPSHFAMKSRAKILFFFNHRSQETDTFFDYRKAPIPSLRASNAISLRDPAGSKDFRVKSTRKANSSPVDEGRKTEPTDERICVLTSPSTPGDCFASLRGIGAP